MSGASTTRVSRTHKTEHVQSRQWADRKRSASSYRSGQTSQATPHTSRTRPKKPAQAEAYGAGPPSQARRTQARDESALGAHGKDKLGQKRTDQTPKGTGQDQAKKDTDQTETNQVQPGQTRADYTKANQHSKNRGHPRKPHAQERDHTSASVGGSASPRQQF